MWTHKHPYRPLELTKEHIQERGEVSLFRALNIKRLVAFVGSGVSVAYGRPSWDDLVDKAVEVAIDSRDKFQRLQNEPTTKPTNASHYPINELARQLKVWQDVSSKSTDEKIMALGLAEKLVSSLGSEFKDELRAALSIKLAESRGSALEKIHEKRSKLFKELVELIPSLDSGSSIQLSPDPIRNLTETLGINRFLTLNYDVEIEREFKKKFRTSNSTHGTNDLEQSAFEALCELSPDDEFLKNTSRNKFNCNVAFQDGLGRTVNSVCLDKDNIGELVNFALFGRQYDAQVFHLHGRFDRPASMVLTEEDYKNTYFQSGESNYTFDEALAALFLGNDVMFVGVGMNEPEMTRPLRQFLSSEQHPDYAAGRVYSLMESEVNLNFDELKTKGEPNETKSYSDQLSELFENDYLRIKSKSDFPVEGQSVEHDFSVGAWSDYRNDASWSLKLHSQYGIYSIFYGGDCSRLLRLACSCLRAYASEDSGTQTMVRIIAPLIARALRDKPNEAASFSNVEQEFLLRKENLFEIVSEDTRDFLVHVLDEPKIIQEALHASAHGNKFRDLRKSWEPTFKQFEMDIRSAILDNALNTLGNKKNQWWQDWKELPHNRSARYGKSYCAKDTELLYPLVSRHVMSYESEGFDYRDEQGHMYDEWRVSVQTLKLVQSIAGDVADKSNSLWNRIRKYKSIDSNESNENLLNWLIEFSPGELKYRRTKSGKLKCVGDITKALPLFDENYQPKRIMRIAMSRGFGKGTLISGLQKDLPAEGAAVQRKYYDALFLPNDKEFRYHGAFFASVSFSMEFSSVLDALKTFLLDALIGIYVEYGTSEVDLEKMECCRNINDGSLAFDIHELFCSESLLLKADCEGKSAEQIELMKLAQNSRLEKNILEKISSHQNINHNERSHRLLELRILLNVFTYTAAAVKTNNSIRLFICLSGMDKLCDESGLAYNPMYRAFFRCLAGNGSKYQAESNPFTPIDYLFISGSTDVPISYLSEQYTAREIEKLLHHAGGPYSSEYQFRPQPNEQIYLKKWYRVPPIPFSDRYWLKQHAAERHMCLLLETYPPAPSYGQSLSHDKFSEIREILKTSVSLHCWASGAMSMRFADSETTISDEQKIEVENYLDRLCRETSQGESVGVLDEIMREFYKGIDENFETMFFNLDELENVSENETVRKKGREIVQVMLSHMALFPMPVPINVLYDCREIYKLLVDIERHDSSITKYDKPHKKKKYRKALLTNIVSSLVRSRLIIRIAPKSHNPLLNQFKSHDELNRKWESENCRFTLQHQLREYFAHSMGLSVPDQGERNFYQLTLYSDQPRDLPTPNGHHYSLFRNIIDDQITKCRHTLWCFYKLHRTTASVEGDEETENVLKINTSSKHDTEIALKGLSRRLIDIDASVGLTEEQRKLGQKLDPTLTSIHAVQQRVRAIYGLLRSGFSIGTLSRLPGFTDTEGPDQPFERHRGWLRGITNVAVGLDHVGSQLEAISNGKPVKLLDHNNCEKLLLNPPEDLDASHIPKVSKPLYKDEVGWLFNERAVIAFTQGNLFDAIPLFRQAKRVMEHASSGDVPPDPALHAAIRRVNLNMSLAQIERGNLTAARKIIDALLVPTDFSNQYDSMVSWIGKGYLGLIKHLNGDLAMAETAYLQTIERATDSEMLRLASIFNRHYADLLRKQGRMDAARQHARHAVASALQSEQRDIFWLAKLSQAHIFIRDQESPHDEEPENTVHNALRYAKSMGAIKIEVEALSIQAQLMLASGDKILAGSVSAQASALAARHGLRLLRLSSLFTYAQSLVGRQQYDLAYGVIKEVRREAERRNYLSGAGNISNLIDQIPNKQRVLHV